jgi:hypothetical protein
MVILFTMTGRMLRGVLQVVVDAVNSENKFPTITSAWDLYLQLQNQEAVTRARKHYSIMIYSVLETSPPCSRSILSSTLRYAADESLNIFDKHAGRDLWVLRLSIFTAIDMHFGII